MKKIIFGVALILTGVIAAASINNAVVATLVSLACMGTAALAVRKERSNER